MTPELISKLTGIAQDNESGSVYITNQCIKTILEYIESVDSNSNEIQADLQNTLIFLEKQFEQFLVMKHFVNFFNDVLKKNFDSKRLQSSLHGYLKNWSEIDLEIANNAIKLLDFNNKTILLHSQSQTIKILLKELKNQNITATFIQTESRPAEEGKAQAQYISDLGFPVTYIADAGVGKFINDIDFALVGADSILETYFINKIGTYPISLLCQDSKTPIYVITDSRKVAHGNYSKQDELEKPPSQLWQHPTSNIQVKNYYYEKIPNRLITKLITELNTF